MEEGKTIIDSKDKNENNKLFKKRKILGNKIAENYLLNIISFLLNNKNNFNEKLKSDDLEIKVYTDSKISSIDNLNYRVDINYCSFNPKRDIINNLSKYKQFPPSIQIKDEYYKENKIFENINIDLNPSINKNMYLDLSFFPFCYYNKEKKILEKYDFLKSKNDKYTLCLYLNHLNESNINKVNKITEDLNNIDNIFDYIENVYIIFQSNTKEEILKIINDEKFNKIFFNNTNNSNDRIKYIFNILKFYEPKNNGEQIINIFSKKFEQEYFFILNQNNKIILIKKDLLFLIRKISLFIINLKKLTNNNNNTNIIEILNEKKIKKMENNDKIREIIYFFSKLKKLDYLFNLKFEISYNFTLNEESFDINIKRINSLNIDGEFRTKEYLYLKKLLNTIKLPNLRKNVILTEIETIDIDIDFTDMKCFKCGKLIPDDKHLYYCYICKTKYCYECVHEQLKKNGKEKYIDQKHNLLFFKTRDKKQFTCLDKVKLGNNRFSESTNDDQFDNYHDAICNGCRGGFQKMARYVCIHCRPGIYLSGGYIDYCQKCIEKMCLNENNKNELEKNSNGKICNENTNFTKDHILYTNHNHDNHLYLLLPLQYNEIEENLYNHY